MTRREPLGEGWDSTAVLVDDTWVERTARRPDVEPWLRTETRLLPWLATQLPVPVPVPELRREGPLVVRHRILRGDPLQDPTPELGTALGAFLAALHAVDLEEAVARGVPDAATTRHLRHAAFERFADDVVPRLPAKRQQEIRDLLDRLRDAPADVLVHGDLNPEHLLTDDARLVGVIDWSDARAGDPAKDLAWALHETPRVFADAVAHTYGATPETTRRAADWLAVGPCYAVAHGLDTGDDALVSASLDQLARGGPTR